MMKPATVASEIAGTLRAGREAQIRWAARLPAQRVHILRGAREDMAAGAVELAQLAACATGRPVAEKLSAEVLPLLEAFRFAERESPRLLATRRLGGRGRPWWLGSVQTEIRREPWGVVLIVGPSNYPLFLPGVQAVQALATGNAVVIKPGAQGREVMERLGAYLVRAGLDPRLWSVQPEDPEIAGELILDGVDKVVLTGSAQTGRAVLELCARTLTPATVELSGCDAMIVREDADLAMVTRALLFGLRLNAGATCIAPRRVLVARRLAERLEAHLASALDDCAKNVADAALSERLQPWIREALRHGATALSGGLREDGRVGLPLVLSGCRPENPLLREDVLAPVASLVFVDNDTEALAVLRRCPFSLGASVFTRDVAAGRVLATRIDAGFVTINDLIVPTADPRIPFGGRRRSGYGVTRGAEGLLEMTTAKVITRTRGVWRPHFDVSGVAEQTIFSAYIEAIHGGGWQRRLSATWRLLSALLRFKRK